MKKKLLSVIFIMLMAVTAMPMTSFGEISEAVVPVRITGTEGGVIKVEKLASGSPTDPDSNCGEFTVPASGMDLTFANEYSGNPPYDEVDYRVTQIPGNDPNTKYDDAVYTVRVYVGYTDGEPGQRASSVAILNKNNDPEKPADICFENKPGSNETEYRNVTRTITYTEYTIDGKEVKRDFVQTVKLKRTVYKNHEGTITGYSDWEYADDATTVEKNTAAVKSPDHPKKAREGWTPNISQVPKWRIDLKNPTDEVIHVIYKPKNQKNNIVKTDEYRTITRTITYTKYTVDGETVSETITQTMRIKRTKTEEIDARTGKVVKTSYSKWSYVSGDRSAVTSPRLEGWGANIAEVPFWEFDEDNPQDEVIHVIYNPAGGKWYHRFLPKTGDEFRHMLFGGVALAAALMMFATRKRRSE